MAEETTEAPPETSEETQGEKPSEEKGGTDSIDYWKHFSRTNEKAAKDARQQAKELQDKLDKVEESNQSETEKALNKARKEAKAEAESEFDKERRADRLAVAVAGHARELADVDDVVLNIERQIAAGDAEVFDSEGKVNADALNKTLEDLLGKKPHLKATGVGKPQGEADGGKGEGGDATSFNDKLRAQAGR